MEYTRTININKEIMNRIGFYYLYEQAEQLGTFNGFRATPHQSVRAVPFELLIEKISIKNAKNV